MLSVIILHLTSLFFSKENGKKLIKHLPLAFIYNFLIITLLGTDQTNLWYDFIIFFKNNQTKVNWWLRVSHLRLTYMYQSLMIIISMAVSVIIPDITLWSASVLWGPVHSHCVISAKWAHKPPRLVVLASHSTHHHFDTGRRQRDCYFMFTVTSELFFFQVVGLFRGKSLCPIEKI